MRAESTSASFSALQSLVNEFNESSAASRFIGRFAAPIFRGPATGEYPILNRQSFKKKTSNRRKADGTFNAITHEIGRETYSVEEYGLEEPITEFKLKKYGSLYDAEAASARILWYQEMMNHEARVYSLWSNAGHTNHNVTTAWSTTASAVPLSDIESGVNAVMDGCGCAKGDISLIIPRADFSEMLKVTEVNDKIKYTYPGIQPAMASAAQVAAMLGIKEVLVATGNYDAYEEGYSESNTQIWTAGVMWLALLCNEDDPLDVPSAARTVLMNDYSPELPTIESYFDPKIKGNVVRCFEATDEIQLGDANVMAYQLTNT